MRPPAVCACDWDDSLDGEGAPHLVEVIGARRGFALCATVECSDDAASHEAAQLFCRERVPSEEAWPVEGRLSARHGACKALTILWGASAMIEFT